MQVGHRPYAGALSVAQGLQCQPCPVEHLQTSAASFAKSDCKQTTNRINGLLSFFVQLLMKASV